MRRMLLFERRRLMAASALPAVSLACAAATPPGLTGSPPVEPMPVVLAPLTTSPREAVSLPRHSLTLFLPESSLWRLNTAGSYVHAVHADTRSDLWVKRWHEGARVSIESCAAQSALWRPELEPPVQPAEQLEMQRVPDGYHTRLSVHVWSRDDTLLGQLTAVGAAIRDCFTYVYQTRAPRSPLASAVIEQRLGAMRAALLDTKHTPVGSY